MRHAGLSSGCLVVMVRAVRPGSSVTHHTREAKWARMACVVNPPAAKSAVDHVRLLIQPLIV
jgi:hypothetical protein